MTESDRQAILKSIKEAKESISHIRNTIADIEDAIGDITIGHLSDLGAADVHYLLHVCQLLRASDEQLRLIFVINACRARGDEKNE